jgi:hypothetical protein
MAAYVMVVTHDDTKDFYFFVGPFNTDIDACAWGVQQDDTHPSWYVLELDNPGAEPCILPPTIRPFAAGRVENIIPPAAGELGRYILCWGDDSYHLIGPFGDADQCDQFVNYDEVDCNNDGPYDDPRWHVLLLDDPSRSPQVVPSTMPPLSAEEVRRQRLKIAEDNAFMKSLSAASCRSEKCRSPSATEQDSIPRKLDS